MSNIVFNEVISQDENEPKVSLQVEQQDESGFTWQILDESDAEPIAEGYSRFQPMAFILGKIAANLWINRNLPTFDPKSADGDQLADLSYCGFNLANNIDEVCEQHNQAAPFWLPFVRDLDSAIDEILDAEDEGDQEDESEDFDDSDFEDDNDDSESDGKYGDLDQEDAIGNYIGDRD